MNVHLSSSQLNKLKSAIKNGTDVILTLSSNMIGNSDDEANFPHKLLLTNRQVASLRKSFANHLLKSVIRLLGVLGLTAVASATDAAINKKILGSGNHTTPIISNDDMQDLLKIVKSLEDSSILLNGITETVKNEVKEQKVAY